MRVFCDVVHDRQAWLAILGSVITYWFILVVVEKEDPTHGMTTEDRELTKRELVRVSCCLTCIPTYAYA